MKPLKKQDRFGINMKQFIRDHEEELRRGLENGEAPEKLMRLHREKLAWLQHERLVHLLVTLTTLLVFLAVTVALVLNPGFVQGLLFLAVAVILIFYLLHYFLLENSVQHWYRLSDELRRKSGDA
ncbi:hypothetical protein [Papillibacter cinnamivorans]|uniref:hypothetical protein n=1 Tax=Papillibacter cinnamivorans TaxID=100176 RepID=UPI0011814617|nr:hypothetical protein [Papillibacter cinnamivorans]